MTDTITIRVNREDFESLTHFQRRGHLLGRGIDVDQMVHMEIDGDELVFTGMPLAKVQGAA